MPINTGTAIRELKIGPYAGGINRYSDQSAIADDEMVDCVNFDIDLDGSLKSRPPWHTQLNVQVGSGEIINSNNQLVLFTGTYEGIQFIIFRSTHLGSPVGTIGIFIYYLNGPNAGQMIQLPGVGDCVVVVRYNDELYLVPNPSATPSASPIGTGYRYVLSTGVVTNISNMPRGYSATIYKDRLWICGRRNVGFTSRLYFSELANFTNWPASNFFDINPGDGDILHDLTVYQDNLMLFKDSATYVLGYDSAPAQAVLQVVNTDVGVTGPWSVVPYENSIFVLKYNEVYEMVNYDYTRVSVKVPFEYDPEIPQEAKDLGAFTWFQARWLRRCGDRLVCRFYNRLYVYHLRLRAWTRWESEDMSIQCLGPIMRLDNTQANANNKQGHEAWVAGMATDITIDQNLPLEPGNSRVFVKILRFDDWYDDSTTEGASIAVDPPQLDIKCSMKTKTYDIGVSHRFKRLMHWGIDTITGRTVTGSVFPYSIVYQPTWAQLHTRFWHELNTWKYPLFVAPSVDVTQPIGAGLARRFIRFPRSLRFRLIQFQVEMLTVGNLSDGPARLYSITAFVGGKQLVPAAVN